MSAEHKRQNLPGESNWVRPFAPDNLRVRRELRRRLPSDSSLDAFCLDYFPRIHGEFADGMARTRKENLLLEQASASEVLASLTIAGALPGYEGSHQTDCAQAAPHAGERSPRLQTWRWLLALTAAALAMLLALVPQGAHIWSRARPEIVGSPPLPLAVPVAAAAPPWLTSEPRDAFVVARSSGKVLGRTPWRLSPDVQESEQVLCLRALGYRARRVRLSPWPAAQPPVHIQLRPATTPDSRSANEDEDCDAPTPLLD